MSGGLVHLDAERDRRERERQALLPQVRAYWVRLATRALDFPLEPVDAGTCHDCRRGPVRRFRYGHVDVCIYDLVRRAKTRARLLQLEKAA